MHIIKLNAIDSTNSYLKELTSKQTVENFTVVMAENQTNAKKCFERIPSWNAISIRLGN